MNWKHVLYDYIGLVIVISIGLALEYAPIYEVIILSYVVYLTGMYILDRNGRDE